MKSTIKHLSLLSVLLLSACGGSDSSPASSDALCTELIGKTYYSNELKATQLGGYSHWSVEFTNNGVFIQNSGDTISNHDFCEQSTAIKDLQRFKFSDDLSLLEVPELSLTYSLAPNDSQQGACELVQNKRYVEDLSGFDDAATRPAAAVYSFNDGYFVTIGDAFSLTQRGIYDCIGGNIHIHQDKFDDKPLLAKINQDASQMTLTVNEQVLSFNHQQIEVCTDDYTPVCSIQASEHPDVSCQVDSCPDGIYKTYSNQCNANVNMAVLQANGECGELEGLAVTVSQGCDAVYQPVCASLIKNEVCIELPCAVEKYQSFGNRCDATVSGANFISEGECGELEGQAVTSNNDVICTADYAPVCGISKANIACITEPCPSYEFKTYSNSCTLNAAGATFVQGNECNNLEGALSLGGPPIIPYAADFTPEPKQTLATAEDWSLSDDILTVNLSYVSCTEQHGDMSTTEAFLESFPVQVASYFIAHQTQACETQINSTHRYDLKPLKRRYQAVYQSENGKIDIGGILYEF